MLALDGWRLAPLYAARYRVVLFDLVGSGNSDLSAYDRTNYASLHGHAEDVLEIARELDDGKPAIFVGHSVSGMIGLLAGIKEPARFAAQIMIGPSPCYINDGDYVGGFERSDIDSLLDTLENNYLGWASNMAPAIMGAPEQPHLREELTMASAGRIRESPSSSRALPSFLICARSYPSCKSQRWSSSATTT